MMRSSQTSRKIEFRAKRMDNNEFVFGDLITFSSRLGPQPCIFVDPRELILDPHETEHYHRIDYQTRGQYTGWEAKGDKKLFEGDVVRQGNTISFVCFHVVNGCWELCSSMREDSGWTCGMNIDVAAQCEIVGNIHDTPNWEEELQYVE